MSKRIFCKHCGQLVKETNTNSGYCFKTRNILKRVEDKLVIVQSLYLDCGKHTGKKIALNINKDNK